MEDKASLLERAFRKLFGERTVEPTLETAEAVSRALGYPGTMMSGSKSGYGKAHPKNIAVFNGNLATKESGKIWYGDLDVTLGSQKISDLAKEIQQDIYLLYEMDGRFENENSPKFERAVFVYKKDGTIEPGSVIEAFIEKAKRGKLAGKFVYKKEYQR